MSEYFIPMISLMLYFIINTLIYRISVENEMFMILQNKA